VWGDQALAAKRFGAYLNQKRAAPVAIVLWIFLKQGGHKVGEKNSLSKKLLLVSHYFELFDSGASNSLLDYGDVNKLIDRLK